MPNICFDIGDAHVSANAPTTADLYAILNRSLESLVSIEQAEILNCPYCDGKECVEYDITLSLDGGREIKDSAAPASGEQIEGETREPVTYLDQSPNPFDYLDCCPDCQAELEAEEKALGIQRDVGPRRAA